MTSSTKTTTILTKVSTLKDICEAVPIPAVAIGGLNAGNMDVLEGAGMSGMAVVSAIMKAEDPKKNARELKEILLRDLCVIHIKRQNHTIINRLILLRKVQMILFV